MKKFLLLLLVIALMLSLSSCVERSKEFSAEGITLTLTNEFKENTQEEYTVCYESDEVAVFVLKESFSLQEGFGDNSVNAYAKLVRSSNTNKKPSDIVEEDGLVYFDYDYYNNDVNEMYKYLTFMYKGHDAFWTVQFACPEELYDEKVDDFKKWAQMVEFEEIEEESKE